MKIYLASPLFTEHERQKVAQVAQLYRELGHSVYVPMEHQIPNAWEMSNPAWAKAVFDEDIKAINEAEMVLCLYYGLYSDSGTAWECGYAYGIGKDVKLIDCANDEVSLMVVQGSVFPTEFICKNQT